MLGKTKALITRAFIHYWWRRRESNPRPKILCLRLYMLSVIESLVTNNPLRLGKSVTSLIGFSAWAPDKAYTRSSLR